MITITGLRKTYGTRAAVDDLSFNVAAGRVTGFVGPNGSGKSTTMRMMVGLTRPDHGSVTYDGIAYTNLRDPARVVGSVLDARSMHPGRSARRHLRAMAALSRLPLARVDTALAEVGLETAADQRAGGFSLGMRQRLALAGALLGDPQVLLLDEPSNGLDPDGIRWLRTYLTAFAQRGGSVFVSSHLIGELAMFADDLVVIGAGKLLAAEPVASITARNAKVVIVETVASEQLAELARHLTAADLGVQTDGTKLLVSGSDRRTVARIAQLHNIPVLELTETARSLEDSLLELTASSAEFASG
jgi:ABC-2 type transport system ATP-binding protein